MRHDLDSHHATLEPAPAPGHPGSDAAHGPASSRRRRPAASRVIATVALAAVATGVGLVAGAGSGPSGVATANAAAAAAGPFQYRKQLVVTTYGHRTPFGAATFTTQTPLETWTGSNGIGAQRRGKVTLTGTSGSKRAQDWRSAGSFGGGSVTGAKAAAGRPSRDPFGNPSPDVSRYRSGDGEIADLDPTTLPTTASALRTRLAATSDAKPGRDENAIDARANLITAEIGLLADGRTPPPVRSALLEVLAQTPGARAAWTDKDATGRSGRRITISLPAARHGGPETYQLIVDQPASQLLEWSRQRSLFNAVGASAGQSEFDLFEPTTTRTVLLDQQQVDSAPPLPPLPGRGPLGS
jgi:hypothetical protein